MINVSPRLWRDRIFLFFWAGQTVSVFGSQITMLAIPLTALLLLEATPWQMGILVALGTVPLFVVSLLAGVLADRRRRMPILIFADVGRAFLLLLVPLALWADLLSMNLLYCIVFLTGALSVFFDVTYQAVLPALVPRELIVDGNSKLETTRAAAEIAGPSIAGALIQIASAPLTVLCDAFSFLLSALLLSRIREPKAIATQPSRHSSIRKDIVEGLQFVLRAPVLRANVAYSATSNFAQGIFEAVYLLYLIDAFMLQPVAIGIVLAGGNVGFLVGALGVERVVQRIGIGRTLIGAALVSELGALPLLLTNGPSFAILSLVIIGRFLSGIGWTMYVITHISLRQRKTPDHLQGRTNASVRFIAGTTFPVGALAGGAIGTQFGLWIALAVAVACGFVALAWLWLSPLRTSDDTYLSRLEV